MYVSPKRLSELIIESQNANKLSDGLVGVLYKIVQGFAARHRSPSFNNAFGDDFSQDFVVNVIKHLHKIDATRNVFGYLTTLASTSTCRAYRERSKESQLAFGDDQKKEVDVSVDSGRAHVAYRLPMKALEPTYRRKPRDSRWVDLTGKTFSRWRVERFSHIAVIAGRRRAYWHCVCRCGVARAVQGIRLTSRQTASCGCLNREVSTTHGLSKSRVYAAWCGMRRRCENPRNKDWSRFGGRGIKVCERWRVFQNFYEDMGEGRRLRRTDRNGNYCKENCVWAKQSNAPIAIG